MNADELFRHYERVVDAPDALPRLRAFCLRLALQGKLTGDGDQTWNEAGILECLEPLDDGKKIHQGWSPQCEGAPSPSEDEWGVLRTTAIQDGFFLQAENKRLPDSLLPRPHLEVRPDDILLTCAGPRARCGIVCRVTTTRRRLMISGKMYRFRADTVRVLPEFLALLLRGEEAQRAINLMKTGSSESGLNLTQDRFSSLRLRFGTLAEQRRIVAKVDELMGLCDRLEAARASVEARRLGLVTECLGRMNVPNEETFPADAEFFVDQIKHVTQGPQGIAQLRRTVLNLAVRGKLVDQREGLDSTLSLLQRISAARPNRAGKRSVVPPATEVHDVPDSWCWTTLGEIIVSGPQNGLSPRPTTRADAPKAITLTATTSGQFDPRFFKRVEANVPPGSELWLQDGDLLFQRGNTREYVGIAAVYSGPQDTFLYPDLMIRVRISPELSLPYIHLAALSPTSRDFMARNATGAQLTMPKINQATLLALPIPVPPREEQDRIVVMVKQLMALCDQLERSIGDVELGRSRLLDSLLRKTLRSGEPMEMAT